LNIVLLALNKASTRSGWLARALNARLYLVKSKPPYSDLTSKITSIINKDFSAIIVELPAAALLVASLLSKKLTRSSVKIVADAHTGLLVSDKLVSKYTVLNALSKLLLRYVDIIVIHNETNYGLLPRRTRSKAVVLHDPFYVVRDYLRGVDCDKVILRYHLESEGYAIYPASWSADEPIEFLVEAWALSNIPVPLVITGKPRLGVLNRVKKYLDQRRVLLTGYIEDYSEYLCTLSRALFVVSATTRNYAMQCTAYEALALGKPLLASNKLAIRNVLRDVPVYFNYSESSLYRAIALLLENYNYVLSRTLKLTRELEERIKREVELFRELILSRH